MESQPQNPELRNNPENFHPCNLQVMKCKCTINSGKDNLWRLQIYAYMLIFPNFIVTNQMQYSVNLERAERE